MSCAYFRPVLDEGSKGVTGVLGYCRGCPTGEIRVPSLEEYSLYCTGKNYTKCPVCQSRKGVLLEGNPEHAYDLIPRT